MPSIVVAAPPAIGATKKVLLSLSVIGAAGSIAALGTFAQFTSSTSASQNFGTGTVTISLGAKGSAANRLDVAAAGMVPGDTVQRSLNLVNAGSVELSGVSLTTSAATSSILDTDAVNGLQLAIDRCSVPWAESAAPYTYTCSGTVSPVVASRPVIGANVELANLSSTAPGATDHLRVTLRLPAEADNAFQGKASSITYTFTGTQRPATAK